MFKIAVPALLVTLAFMAPRCPSSSPGGCTRNHEDPTDDVQEATIDMTFVTAQHESHSSVVSDDTDPDVAISFQEPWPPDPFAYSWYVKITLHSTSPEPNGTTIEIIKQRHDGL